MKLTPDTKVMLVRRASAGEWDQTGPADRLPIGALVSEVDCAWIRMQLPNPNLPPANEGKLGLVPLEQIEAMMDMLGAAYVFRVTGYAKTDARPMCELVWPAHNPIPADLPFVPLRPEDLSV